jgi:rhamnose transport system permease protein
MKLLRRIVQPEQLRELGLLLLIFAAVLFFGSQISGYFGGRTFNRISTSIAIVAVVAIGQTVVVLTRNIDLSVGSIVGFTAYFIGTQVAAAPDMQPIVVVMYAAAVGAALGTINGLLVAYGRVPAIIVTLGTLALFRGALVSYSDSKTVTAQSLPEWLVNLPSTNVFSVGELDFRLLFVMALLLIVIAQVVLTFTSFGRRLYAIGSNPDAASTLGLPARRITFTAYLISGAMSGIAGFMTLGRYGNITVEAALGLELQVVAAVVVGGVNIFGGSGTMIGAFLGAVLIGTLEQSLNRLRISEFWKDFVLGLLILMSVAVDAVLLNRLRKIWTRSDMQMIPAARPERTVVNTPQ